MSHLSYTQEFNENLFMLLMRDPERYMPIVEFFDNVTRKLFELSWSEAELVANEISKANHSEFCNGIRTGMTDALNLDPSALQNAKLAPVLAFALKVNGDAGSISKTDIQVVLDAGWSEQTIEDIVGLVAAQRLYNTLATGLGFKGLSAAAFAEIGRDTVNRGGYTASFRAFLDARDNRDRI